MNVFWLVDDQRALHEDIILAAVLEAHAGIVSRGYPVRSNHVVSVEFFGDEHDDQPHHFYALSKQLFFFFKGGIRDSQGLTIPRNHLLGALDALAAIVTAVNGCLGQGKLLG